MNSPLFISGRTCVEAYCGVLDALIAEHPLFHVFVNIESPCGNSESDYEMFCPTRVRSDGDSIRDVANTIFPDRDSSNFESPKDFLDYYKGVYDRGLRRTRGAWGTYFQRLVSFGNEGRSQLEMVIDALNNWEKKAYRSSFVFHLSGAHLDKPKKMGAPCWQYGQISCDPEDTLHFSVVYRSHDYFNKALGNYWGLSRLLSFICSATGKSPGTLTCHSMVAHYQNARLKDLKNLRDFYNDQETA